MSTGGKAPTFPQILTPPPSGTPAFSSSVVGGSGSDCMNVVDRIRSMRASSYRHLSADSSYPETGYTDPADTTNLHRNAGAGLDHGQVVVKIHNEDVVTDQADKRLRKSVTSLERRARAASVGGCIEIPAAGPNNKVHFVQGAGAKLEQDDGRGSLESDGFLGDRWSMMDETKWRAKSFDMGGLDVSRGASLRQPPESSGSLLRREMQEMQQGFESRDVASLTGMPEWPLPRRRPHMKSNMSTSTQQVSSIDDSSAAQMSSRIGILESSTSSARASPLLMMAGAPLGNVAETIEQKDCYQHADELANLRSRNTSLHRSFRDEEMIVKSPALPAGHYNRMKSRFSEPTKPPVSSTEFTSGFIRRSGQLKQGGMRSGQLKQGGMRSGQLKQGGMRSGQLKSQQMKSGLIPRTGILGRVNEEEDDPFKDLDLPDRPKYVRKWSWWVCLEWAALLLNLAALTCTRTIPQLKDVSLIGLLLWKWILLLLVVLCGRLVSGWVVLIIVFLIERNFLMRKRVLYFVYALRRGVEYCTWLALVLMAWNFMFDSRVATANRKLVYVTKALQCLLIGSVLFLVKVFLVKVLASCFHVGTYFERIRDSLFNQYVLETLSGPPVLEIEQIADDEQKLMDEVALLRKAGATAPGLIGLSGDPRSATFKSQKTMKRSKTLASGDVKAGSEISVQHLHKMNRKNVSAWNMKRLINLVKYQGVTTLSQTIDDDVAGEGMDTEIRSEWQAKAAAKEIFNNVARPGMTYLDDEDLMRFMQEEEAIRALALFDGAMESGKITKKALKSWVVNVYQERRALALSLSDTKTAVNKLHRILDVVLFVLVGIIWLLVLGVATQKLLVFVTSQLLLIVFIFGNTLKTIFEAIVFLFVMHPYDVGDRCVIDGVQYVVEEMNILTTVFLGDANAKVWFPNSVLATKPISNFYRSPDMGDCFDFIVSASTTAEKIGLLKGRIEKYITSKPHHWKATFGLNVSDMQMEGGKLKLSLGLSHTMNHQNIGEKVTRRSDLMWELKRIFEELSIEYILPSQEVHVKTLPGSSISFTQSPR